VLFQIIGDVGNGTDLGFARRSLRTRAAFVFAIVPEVTIHLWSHRIATRRLKQLILSDLDQLGKLIEEVSMYEKKPLFQSIHGQ
jgi:hypothetical protein